MRKFEELSQKEQEEILQQIKKQREEFEIKELMGKDES